MMVIQVLDALSVDKRLDLDADLETWTENLVRHSMLVAHLCLDRYRNIIVKTCQRVSPGLIAALHVIMCSSQNL